MVAFAMYWPDNPIYIQTQGQLSAVNAEIAAAISRFYAECGDTSMLVLT